MKQDEIYMIIEMECRKQLFHGEIKGTTAKFISDNLGMKRPNVVRELKKLIDMGSVYKSEGRPVYYYIDPSCIDINKEILDERNMLSNNIDDYIKNKKSKLMTEGFTAEEIREKLIVEMEQYVNRYFTALSNRDSSYLEDNKDFEDVKYIIGVDGGGTKTEAIAYSLDGKELARGYAGFGNIMIDKETGLKNIELSILECTKNLRWEDCLFLYLGLAGCEAGDNKIIIERFLKARFPWPIKIVNDGQLALSALLKGEEGILTIAGTGSITIGKQGGTEARVGGWGHLIGDEGSGYYISMEGIKNVFLENDLGLEDSLLTKEIFKATNCSNRRQLCEFVYNSNKGEIAALVPTVVRMAKKGDSTSIEILKRAGRFLAENTMRAIKLLNIKGRVKVAIKGSIITKIPLVKETFINEFYLKDIKIKLYDEEVPSAKGAYYELLKEFKAEKM